MVEKGIELLKRRTIRQQSSKVVPGTGLEPARLSALDPKSSASTNFAIPALEGRQSNESDTHGKPDLGQGLCVKVRVGVLCASGKLRGFGSARYDGL